MRVKATEIGYHGFLRRREGDVFNIRKLSEFSPNWMEFMNEGNIPLYNDYVTKKLTDEANAPKHAKGSLQDKINSSLVLPKKVAKIDEDAPPVPEDAPNEVVEEFSEEPEPEVAESKKKKGFLGRKK